MPNRNGVMWTMAGAAGLLAGALGIRIYNFLSGRNLIRDGLEQAYLARLPLAACDQFWARNPQAADIVVCLTTTPSRLPYIAGTLKSLLRQTRRPQRIRLHLPGFSRREQRPYPVPAHLAALQAVDVVRCADYGPATKLLPALPAFAPEQKLLVVDDDMLYPADLVDNFFRWSKAYPHLALGSSGWVVPTDLTDRPTTLLSNLRQSPPTPRKSTRIKAPVQVDILQGYSGYLVRPAFFNAEVFTAYASAPAEAFFQDDVWISAHCTAPKYVFPARRYCFHLWPTRRFYQATSISRLNRGGGDPEKRVNTILIRHFKERWLFNHPRAPALPPSR